MSKSSENKKRKSPAAIICILLIVGILAFYFYSRLIGHGNPITRNSDIKKLSESSYDALILGMDQPFFLPEEKMEYYLGGKYLSAEHSFYTFADVSSFVDRFMNHSDNHSGAIYLEINPWLLSSRAFGLTSIYSRLYEASLGKLVSGNPELHFHITFASPSLDSWNKLSTEKQEAALENFTNMVNMLSCKDNVKLTWLGDQEWLIANPANYEKINDIYHTALTSADTLCGNILSDPAYTINSDCVVDRIAILKNLIAQNKAYSYPLKRDQTGEYSIFFLGDSVMGNYQDSLSIPGVVNGMTTASCINLGIGGSSAAYRTAHNGGELPPSLMEMVDALTHAVDAPDSYPEQYPNKELLEKGLSKLSADKDYSRTCFVLNYGLNDYFQGNSLVDIAEDTSDDLPILQKYGNRVTCFEGALETAVTVLQTNFPGCHILLMGSNFTTEFDFGRGIQGTTAGSLSDYIETTKKVASQLGVHFLSSYELLGINDNNHQFFLEDGTHPNVNARFQMGQAISQEVYGMFQE